MDRIPIGKLIRRRREELGVTQEELGQDNIDPGTISKIENGKADPTSRTLRTLLQRLNLPDTYYTVPVTENEATLENLLLEARAKVVAAQRAVPAERAALRREALIALDKIEEQYGTNDVYIRQRLAGDRIALGGPDGDYSQLQQREMLLAALRLTVPSFTVEKLSSFWYTSDETEIINQIAVTFSAEKDYLSAIYIYSHLLEYLKNHSDQLPRYPGQATMVAFNYACALVNEGRYEEAVQAAEIGRQDCVAYGKHQFHPQLLAVLANCHAHLGNLRESEEYYRQAYYLYKTFEEWDNLEHLQTDALETLGFELP